MFTYTVKKIVVLSLWLVMSASLVARVINEVSYPLPGVSLYPDGAVFSPNGLYLATCNTGSEDVSVFNVGVGGSCRKVIPFLFLRVLQRPKQ